MESAMEQRKSDRTSTRAPLCFVSHAWADEGHAFALELSQELRPRGIIPWLDEERIPLGSSVRHSCRDGVLRKCDVFLALVSQDWRASTACQEELQCALERQSKEALQILPVHRTRDVQPIPELANARYTELPDLEDSQCIDRLAEAIRRATAVSRLAGSLREGNPRDRREAAKLLGQVAEPSAAHCLSRSLTEDSDALTRYWAAIALGRIATAEACDRLRNAAGTEEDAHVSQGIKEALERGCLAEDTR